MEDAVAVRLEHARVRVEARVAELGDLLGEELDAVGRVAEDDRLVDLELQEEGESQVALKKSERGWTAKESDAPSRTGC